MSYGLGNIFHTLNVMGSVGVPLSYQDIKKLKIALVHMSETTKNKSKAFTVITVIMTMVVTIVQSCIN